MARGIAVRAGLRVGPHARKGVHPHAATAPRQRRNRNAMTPQSAGDDGAIVVQLILKNEEKSKLV